MGNHPAHGTFTCYKCKIRDMPAATAAKHFASCPGGNRRFKKTGAYTL